MIYKKILVYTDNVEEASGVLIMLGAAGTEVISRNADDLLCFNFDYVDMELPAKNGVAAYFEDAADGSNFLSAADIALKALKNAGFTDVEVSEIDTASYEDEWKKYLKPVELSRFWVVPLIGEGAAVGAGEGDASDKVEAAPGAARKERIEIVPGRAFGTGMHETTRLCVELLTKYVNSEATVADIGTGSGILAIAAKKLGAVTVYGVDNDADALENARMNAALNGADIRFDCADLARTISGTVDIVVANIAVKAVIELAEMARALLSAGGIYICSGIILSERQNVRDALARLGYEVMEAPEMGEWCAVAARRCADCAQ